MKLTSPCSSLPPKCCCCYGLKFVSSSKNSTWYIIFICRASSSCEAEIPFGPAPDSLNDTDGSFSSFHPHLLPATVFWWWCAHCIVFWWGRVRPNVHYLSVPVLRFSGSLFNRNKVPSTLDLRAKRAPTVVRNFFAIVMGLTVRVSAETLYGRNGAFSATLAI